MTPRANLLRTLRGEEPAWVPFAPNIWQWFDHHRAHGILPPELAGCRDHIDALIAIGADVFTRNHAGGVGARDTTIPAVVETTTNHLGKRTVRRWATPYGELRDVSQEQAALTTSHNEEYLVKDWSRDRDAVLAWLDQRRWEWNEAQFIEVHGRVGERGLINVPVGQTPLKMLHWLFGLDGACLFANDHPEDAQHLCDRHWAGLRPWFVRLAADDRVHSAILMDNVDTPFYSPALARRFWLPNVADASAIMAKAGKSLFVHACGKLARLAPIFAEAGVSGLEGISHAPLGDWSAAAAQRCHPGFVFVGGFSAREQTILDDAGVDAFYRDYLGASQRRRFIFSASCQTAIDTPLARILRVRDLCREWGGRPV